MEMIIDNEDMTLGAEEYEGDIYLHIGINQWSHEAYKRMLVLAEYVKEAFKKRGYTRLLSISPKGPESKLTEMFGMAHVGETDDCYVNEVLL